mgnify:CR=1 FL=1
MSARNKSASLREKGKSHNRPDSVKPPVRYAYERVLGSKLLRSWPKSCVASFAAVAGTFSSKDAIYHTPRLGSAHVPEPM